jgi:hypothetical protein
MTKKALALDDLELDKFDTNSSNETVVRIVEAAGLSAPASANSGTIEYPNSTTEIIKFRSGGIAGTVLKTLTLYYSDSTKTELTGWE